MMSIHVTPERSRIAWRVSLAAAAAGLLLAGSLWTPAALAQNDGGQPAKTGSGQSTSSDGAQKPADNASKSSDKLSLGTQDIDPNATIKPGFVLGVNIAGETDASGNYPVDAGGAINIHYAGVTVPVSVKGMTPAQAHIAVVNAMKKYIKKPDVSVSIVAVPRPTVFLSGALRATGEAQIRSDTNLVELLSRAEWLDNADLSQVRLIHPAQNAQTKSNVETIDVDKYIKPAGKPLDQSLNPILHDKDRIFVPFKSVSGTGTISVTGDVTSPKPSIPYRSTPPMTVREAVNLAGGVNPTANRQAVTVRRPGLDKPLLIDLEKAEQGDLVNNIELKPDDAVYVAPLQENKFVNVVGGVAKPGKIVFDKSTMTLTEAVTAAGGVTATAKKKDCVIFRGADTGNTQAIKFNWDDLQKGKTKDIALQPGDNIFIEPGSTTHEPGIIEKLMPIIRDGALFFSVLRR